MSDAPATYTLDTAIANDEKMLADAAALIAGKEPPALRHMLERVRTFRTSMLVAWIADPETTITLLEVNPNRFSTSEDKAFRKAVVLVALGAVRDELDRRIQVSA